MNTIILADCVHAMANLDPASVDFVLTDPPYLVNYRGRDGRTVTNDDNAHWLRPAFSQIYRVLKPASCCVSFCAWNKVHLFGLNLAKAGISAK
jgi:DNA modification methylase